MGTIREITKRDGSVMHHAEIRLRGHPPQCQSFRTKTQAKKWIQDTERNRHSHLFRWQCEKNERGTP